MYVDISFILRYNDNIQHAKEISVKHLKFIAAQMEDLALIRSVYWSLIDSSDTYTDILRWKKDVYPAEADWINYIHNQEMFLIYDADRLVGAVALVKSQPEAYRNIPWVVAAGDAEILVIHLLAICPGLHGQGYATAALNEIMMLASVWGKRVVRLDAIATNKPAQKLYEAYGFQNRGMERLYYESTGYTDFIFYEYPVE